ncbi:MAG: mandelate racemase/muconate lactonizing enzyme family protein [Candidatus Latescibacteria bacterium]|nr:mandelate racemase/muconate lactonizing enzyme family protein [Candidatus Latescibacterota bacterium]
MKIERIETIVLTCPWGPAEEGVTRRWPLQLIYADNGLCGIGRGGDVGLIEREFAPLLIGEDPRSTTRLWQQMYESAWRFRGPGRAAMVTIGALDVALWDLKGKACGEPVWRLLGGYRDRVPAYADGIGYNADLTAEDVAGLVRNHVELGYEAVKFHLTVPDPDLAVEKARLSREALGPDKRLMVDVHRMWPGPLAVEMARRFAPYDLYWIEEPVYADDEPGTMRMVRDAANALIAGGEGEPTLYGAHRLVVEGGLQVVQTDILVGGGFTGLMRIAAMAASHHVPVSPHGASFPEINCHLVAAVSNGLIVPACPHTEPYQIWSQLYDPPFQVEGGEIAMSDAPGLGLELNESFVSDHRA